MMYLILIYFLFSLIVILRQQKSLNLVWFLMMPVGFCLALSGLMLFPEYVSFANFLDNPLFGGNTLYIWKLNYYLKLNIFGMYRLMNIGIALYMVGAIGFPLSQHPRRNFIKNGGLLVVIPAVLILLDDPGLLQAIFRPDSVFTVSVSPEAIVMTGARAAS